MPVTIKHAGTTPAQNRHVLSLIMNLTMKIQDIVPRVKSSHVKSKENIKAGLG
jgi:hypothetical protein